jgi:hypothetical protein
MFYKPLFAFFVGPIAVIVTLACLPSGKAQAQANPTFPGWSDAQLQGHFEACVRFSPDAKALPNPFNKKYCACRVIELTKLISGDGWDTMSKADPKRLDTIMGAAAAKCANYLPSLI